MKNINNENDILTGKFTYTMYKTTSYMVTRFETEEGTIVVTGPSFDYEKDAKYIIEGNYTNHPKYGFQFNMTSISKYIPTQKEEIVKFLKSSIFKKIGVKTAEKIYNCFGDDTLKILKANPQDIMSCNISNEQKESIINGFNSILDGDNNDVFMLLNLGFSNTEATLISNRFKNNLDDVILSNPYKFYLDIYGMSFDKVNKCVSKLEFENKELFYKEAYLIALFKFLSFNTGDIYLHYDYLNDEYSKNYSDFDIVLDKATNDSYLYVEDNHIYLMSDYQDEYLTANELFYQKEPINIDETNLKIAINDIQKELNIEYDNDQLDAINAFFNNDVSIIVGGPGSGKTTLIKSLVTIFKNNFTYKNIIVVAPTGRAAKRINEICDVESKTIHSLLRWDKESNLFAFNEDNPILYDALIIDEFSMVDSSLFASLLRASSYVKKICIIGDINQLPSIRQGQVLKDLVDSNIFKVTYLKNNHRQKEGNDIISLANDIVNNKVDFDNYKNDIEFIDIDTIKHTDIINMIDKSLEQGLTFENIEVLAPMYRGEFGIDNMNMILQNAYNPKNNNKNEKRYNNVIFREGDKVLQLKNRPNDDVYNGDIGILNEINEEDKYFLVDYQGTLVFYEYNTDIQDLSLAYCLSVHKSQGSEYNTVFVICAKEHNRMISKKLLYTAISRAKNKLYIIGKKDLFISGLNRIDRDRNTTLKERLKNL